MKYLDPKADLTFKKVFGTHPDLVISLINALLPLTDDEQVESVEYLFVDESEYTPLRENNVLNVRCKDVCGGTFYVEIQIIWTLTFMQCIRFCDEKAYINMEVEKGHYKDLYPVYSLNFVNDKLGHDVTDFLHSYNVFFR